MAAAFLQNARSALQTHLKGRIGQHGATFVRFGFGAPVALGYFAVVATLIEAPVEPSAAWALYMVFGAGTQVAATYALLASFDQAGFGAGTAYSKTEPIQAALIAAVILGEFPTPGALLAILTGVGGVFLLATREARALFASQRGLALGLLAALLFGASAVSFRAASLSLAEGGFMIRAAQTLVSATLLQALAFGGWLALTRPAELARVAASWRWGLGAGAAGALASAGWFTAMTLEPAAHVRALAQVELVFTALVATLWFGERQSPRALAGVGLIAGGAVLLLLST